MAKKKMTIEDLAVMTQKGFLEVGVRFDKVEEDMKSVKSDVSGLKESNKEIVASIDYLVGTAKKQEQEHLFLNAQVRRVEVRVDKLEAKKS